MKKKTALVLGVALIAISAAAATLAPHLSTTEASAVDDPRQVPPLVMLATAVTSADSQLSFTGTVGAKVESSLGFRVPGKIIERLVDTGEQVKAGQPLMRIDETDLQLAVSAKRFAVAAARAIMVQMEADEKRYAVLVKDGRAASPQRYEQAKAALDTAAAQLAAAEAEARVAENEATYAVLLANADGTVVEAIGEPGQVVAAGQAVVRIAQAGPREAVISLPETFRPEIGTLAEASLYGWGDQRFKASLRQLSDAADPLTRTFEARYVLEGKAASAPLGATVTIRLSRKSAAPTVEVPIGAILDNGEKTGVWRLEHSTSSVHFQPVSLVRMSSEMAEISGLDAGVSVVSLGAHLLRDGSSVRTVATHGVQR
ncbi:efflux RND transporter periplasmic adaptor subunit [Roseibium suaedae]|uniref:RND family efflux transporter, MFP subunit n=1 Tax=Roseibium suaedae TaxID=735517 RepID=A0A1M7PKF7_9HYPH|nr:efflux RND transporter periplasmic adaptor subunit [Roseibium suaedae]SHN17493.1 RND family efflux transporter, MFP subunit [Roseibium suaedae]